ncbi:MAG: anaerobic ribonucleoside-triphosphate reductase activating protein [Spirochaetes bacterium]|nr:anaerobic ribonucleoside-triphosphate reductase activating protein [Spirochaetota bacterium]MBU0953932.1 anaerobic ribonucleoside-triphosphate reductase activating protein [Spirochaetota bacterium]
MQKLSLIDYPGKVACVLFLPGCNFRCPYCQNADLVYNRHSEELVALEEAFMHLGRRQGIITAAVISGGEPLLRETMPELVQSLRKRGVLVKLDTNGAFPDRILAADADFYALDIKTSPDRYDELWQLPPEDAAARILRSIDVVRGSGKPYEFRITCAPGIFGRSEAEAVSALLQPDDAVVLQRCRLDTVLDPDWAAGVNEYTEAELSELLQIIQKNCPQARLRNN